MWEWEVKRIALRKLGLCMQKIMAGSTRGRVFNWKFKKDMWLQDQAIQEVSNVGIQRPMEPFPFSSPPPQPRAG